MVVRLPHQDTTKTQERKAMKWHKETIPATVWNKQGSPIGTTELSLGDWATKLLVASCNRQSDHFIHKERLEEVAKQHEVKVSSKLKKKELVKLIVSSVKPEDLCEILDQFGIGVDKWTYLGAGLPEQSWPSFRRKLRLVQKVWRKGILHDYTIGYYSVREFLEWRSERR
jgi:hypothetical protein